MKTLNLFFAALLLVTTTASAQTADEVVKNYFENTGGLANWGKLSGVKMSAVVNAQGMEIPVEIYQMKDGKQLVKINIQGQEMTQFAFDGETMWTTNMMTMKPEKSDSEATENMKKQAKDFPSPLFNYKEKGYTIERLENETKEGTETFKIRLTQKPVMVNGKEEPNVSFHYFDTDSYALILSEAEVKQGPMKGQMSTTTMSDYQEVEGLYFPFSMSMAGQGVKIKNIELNPEVEATLFAFPEEN